MKEHQYYLYMMTNYEETTLYIGITNNLERRVYEHKNKIVKGFTSKYNLNKLVYYELYNEVKQAIFREKQLKNWHKEWKINLIKEFNPEFKDLSIIDSHYQTVIPEPINCHPELVSGSTRKTI